MKAPPAIARLFERSRERSPGSSRRVVLHAGSGFGDDFLALWQAWRQDPAGVERLVCIAINPGPPDRARLARSLAGSPVPSLADALIAAWPEPTPDLHRLAFDAGRVELLLAFGAPRDRLPQVVAEVDAFLIDGDPSHASDAGPRAFDGRVCKALARLAAPGAVLAARHADDALCCDLRSAGFAMGPPSDDGDEAAGVTWARYEPPFVPRRAAARVTRVSDEQPSETPTERPTERHALVVGAGLAGCAAVRALADQGWRSTLVDRAPRLASGASGNPAGLFHGVVHAADGPHARFNRSAALQAAAAIGAAIDDGVPGRIDGLLRLERSLPVERMRARLVRLALPPGYVQALSAPEASALAGIELREPAWFYPRGGWVDPAALSAWFVAQAGAAVETRLGAAVDRLERTATGWRLLDADGRAIATAPVVVLANADGAARLLDRHELEKARPGEPGPTVPPWPAESRRGQLSIAPAEAAPQLLRPVAGDGYLLPPSGGRVCFGATSQLDDPDPTARLADQAANLDRLEHLLGRATGLQPASLAGRTAWRYAAADRLPIVGAVPDLQAPATRRDQPRFVPRHPGLYVAVGLGSRGITWSTLVARVLAGWVGGAPMPVDASLLDAIDPARFACRVARHATERAPTADR